MTNKQPDALELASVAESADLAGYPTAKKANAYCLCLLEDCAQMIRRLHGENETLRAGYAAARLEIESLKAQLAERAKEHADELAVAYMCGASREKELAAQQPGAAYAAQDSEHQRAIMEGERNASLDAYSRVVSITSAESRLYERAFTSGWDRRDRLASYGQAPAQPAPAAVAGTSLQHIHDLLYTAQRTTGDAQAQAIAEARIALSDLMTAPEPVLATRAWPKVSGVSRDEGHPQALLVFFSAEPTDDEMRAVHGTLAAALTTQPTPQQEPSYTSAQLAEMVLSDCGHSSNYTPLLNRVAARIDAHVERCLESKKTTQQEAQEPVEMPAAIEQMATGRYKVVPSHESMSHRWAVVAETGARQLYLGREVECQNMARKFARAFLDGVYVALRNAAPQPSPAAQGDAVKQLGWVYCYQGQEPAFSYTPQPPGIPKTHYWQVPVFDIGQARKQGANHD